MVKGLNPADQFRKLEKKKEIKKSKREKEEVKKVQNLLNNPRAIEIEIEKYEKLSSENLLDKSLKDKIKELRMMKGVALQKEKIRNDTARLKHPSLSKPSSEGSADIVNYKSVASHEPAEISQQTTQTSPLSCSSTLASNLLETRNPSESIFYHPVYNPTGTPPPGQQQMYRAKTSANTSVAPASSFVPLHSRQVPNYTNPGSCIQIGGQNGIPLPPPPRPISISSGAVMGGLNGVPLPPPRPGLPIRLPMGSSQPVPFQTSMYSLPGGLPVGGSTVPQPPSSSGGPYRQLHAQANRAAALDPLDPTQKSYTDRFQTSLLHPPPPRHTPTPPPFTALTEATPILPPSIKPPTETTCLQTDPSIHEQDQDGNDNCAETTEFEEEEQKLIEMRLQRHLQMALNSTSSSVSAFLPSEATSLLHSQISYSGLQEPSDSALLESNNQHSSEPPFKPQLPPPPPPPTQNISTATHSSNCVLVVSPAGPVQQQQSGPSTCQETHTTTPPFSVISSWTASSAASAPQIPSAPILSMAELIMSRRRNADLELANAPGGPSAALSTHDSASLVESQPLPGRHPIDFEPSKGSAVEYTSRRKESVQGDVLSALCDYSDNEDDDACLGNYAHGIHADDDILTPYIPQLPLSRHELPNSQPLLQQQSLTAYPGPTLPTVMPLSLSMPLPASLPEPLNQYPIHPLLQAFPTRNNQMSSLPGGSKQGKVLKVIKADAGLTAFVPSAIRTKRVGEMLQKPTSKAPRHLSFENREASNNITNSKQSSGVVAAAPPHSVDDAYNDFLNEISQLTG